MKAPGQKRSAAAARHHCRQRVAFTASLLHPGHWGTWVILGALCLVSLLPRRCIMSLGGWLGERLLGRNRKRRRIAARNIEICFPELTQQQRDELLRQHFRRYGQTMIDLWTVMHCNRRQFEKICSVQGEEHLRLRGKDTRTILLAYHMLTLDMCGGHIKLNVDVVTMMKEDRNPVINFFLNRGRTRHGRAEMLLRGDGLRGIVRGIRQGRVCYFVPDEDFGDRENSVFAAFFGQQKATLSSVSRIAGLTNAVVVPVICRLDPQSGNYVIEYHPPLDDFPSGDLQTDAANANATMERLIRRSPEQYFWTFRIFQTQPEGEPGLYDDLPH